ncbi:MAG: type II secretion system protein [Anaerolineales bacterium]
MNFGGRRAATLSTQRGVTYLMVMFLIVMMGIGMTLVSRQWAVTVKRDQEAELLFRGNRILVAIQSFAADYQVKKATRPNQYPLSLEELTKPPKRYLQVVYKDPVTGQDFELLKAGAEIRGVKSRSAAAPLDRVRFHHATAYNQVTFQVQVAASPACIPGPNPLNPFAPPVICPPPGTQAPAVPGLPGTPSAGTP